MTLARSCGLLRPAKVILVPGANFFGLGSQALRLSQFQVPPTPASAGEKAKPRPFPIGSPSTPHRFGPSALAPPLSALWHASALLEDLLARGGVRRCEIESDRLFRFRSAFAFLNHALDRIAHLFRALALGRISPATIEPPRATIPANKVQPAMVLKRSSMGLQTADAEAI